MLQMLKRLQIRDMSRCQKYLIPAVLSGQNVTVIDGPEAGKTAGVLISLVSLMRKSSKEVGLTKTWFLINTVSQYIDTAFIKFSFYQEVILVMLVFPLLYKFTMSYTVG